MKILVEKEVIEQALEALEQHGKAYLNHDEPYNKAITALRKALDPELQFVRDWNEGKVRRVFDGKVMGVAEQAEQEPVACYPCEIVEADFSKDELVIKMTGTDPYKVSAGTKYLCESAPVRTKDLTDEELWEAAKTAKSNDLIDAFRAVIAADRRKNK